MGTFYFHYQATYGDMIRSLEDRAFSIYHYVDGTLDKTTYEKIDSAEDKQKASYQQMKESLEAIKTSSDVRYLYTAKKNERGEFVYVIDGLPSNAEDFRNPGDLIEPEIYPDMQRALDGETVLPDDIKETTWGKIFITYFPIHDGDRVVGVLGIEFEAEHQFDTFRSIRIFTPIAAVFVCLVAMCLAVLFFKRISNPTYQDMANTDQLTQLKSRNAYDVDFRNLAAQRREKGAGVVVLDLNNLKWVNDTLGHQAGDEYIQKAAEAIRSVLEKPEVAYRIGGDEFVLFVPDATEEKLENLKERIQVEFARRKPDVAVELSIAMGCALYEKGRDQSLSDTCRRADKEMYRNKQNSRREN